MMQKPSPILVVDRFPGLLDALLNLLTNLSAEDWNRPTISAGWNVKDIALHLLGGDVGILSGKRDGFSEPHDAFQTWDELVAWVDQKNELWVQTTRRVSPMLLCDLLRFTGDQVNAYFRSLNVNALGGLVSWAGSAPAPVWLDIAREFTERWHHQQHIRDAVGSPGAKEPYYLAPVLSTFVYALPHTYQSVDAPEGTIVTLTITGESGGTWSIRREQERWALYIGRPTQPHAEIILPEDIAWRVFTNGIEKGPARASANLMGDLDLAEKALETISIIAPKNPSADEA